MNGLILAGANSSRSVPRQNRVYDLRPDPADGEIFDRSRNGNNAILSTGWAVTLDGITGHMQVDFATQQNVTVLTARVRSSTDTTFYAGTENASGTDTIVANDTWQDVSVTISDAVADELFVGSDDGSTNFFAGDICDVRVASVGTWYLNDHPAGSLDGLPAFDSSGNGNDGVHVGGTSIVGEGAPVPQTALQDWNAGGTGPTAIYESDFSVNADGWFASSISVSGNQDGINGEDNCLLLNSGVAAGGRFNLNSLTLGMVIGKTYRLDFRYYAATSADDGLFFQIGDEFDSSSYLILEADNQTVIGGSWQTVSLYFTADASGVKLKLTTTNTAALGELNSNISNDFYFKDLVLREWFSSSVYLPEASDNPGFDTFGNAIANPRGYLLNPRGESGDSITILEDATLGAMKTWAMIVNYDGEDQTLLDLGTPEITIASDTIATSGITSPTIYVDGVATTTLTTGRHLIVVTTETATDCGPITCSNLIQNGKDVGYDTNPLSASGVSQLYRALRRYL
jgi:hypothetical protein